MGHIVDWERVDCQLDRGRSESEGETGVFPNWEGLVKLGRKSFKVRGVGGSRDRGVDHD